MYSKLSALAALIPFVNALTIDTPTGWNSGGNATISWTTAPGDPSTWSFELINTNLFHNAFALANNVDPSLGSIDINLPSVPQDDGYTLEAVNITDINQVFATSGDFAIGATVSTTSSSSSTSSGSSTSGSAVTRVVASTTSQFGVTLSSSTGFPSPSGSSGSSSSSSTSSSSSVSPSSFNGNGNHNGAVSISGGVMAWISMLFAAGAGAAVAL